LHFVRLSSYASEFWNMRLGERDDGVSGAAMRKVPSGLKACGEIKNVGLMKPAGPY